MSMRLALLTLNGLIFCLVLRQFWRSQSLVFKQAARFSQVGRQLMKNSFPADFLPKLFSYVQITIFIFSFLTNCMQKTQTIHFPLLNLLSLDAKIKKKKNIHNIFETWE